MAVIEITRPATGLFAGRSANIFSAAMAAIVSWNDARATRKALSGLSARELDDIGLTRADIDTVATIIR